MENKEISNNENVCQILDHQDVEINCFGAFCGNLALVLNILDKKECTRKSVETFDICKISHITSLHFKKIAAQAQIL